MWRLQQSGFELVIITNQSGIARGYYDEKDYQLLTKCMLTELNRRGVYVNGVYYCPHYMNGRVPQFSINCECRKPKPGMILRAAREINISLSDSILIGDKTSDIEAARAAGVGCAYLVGEQLHDTGARAQRLDDGAFANLFECTTKLYSS